MLKASHFFAKWGCVTIYAHIVDLAMTRAVEKKHLQYSCMSETKYWTIVRLAQRCFFLYHYYGFFEVNILLSWSFF